MMLQMSENLNVFGILKMLLPGSFLQVFMELISTLWIFHHLNFIYDAANE